MLDNISLCIARLDKHGRFIQVNLAFTQIFGLPAEHFVGRYISEIGRSGDEAQIAGLETLISKVFAEGRANNCEVQWMTNEGEEAFDILHVPERNEDGRVVSVLGIIKRKSDEQSYLERDSLLHALSDVIPVPIFYKDRQGRYLGFNRAYEVFFGASKDQLVGKSVFDISPLELANIYYAKDNELFVNGGEQIYESQVKNTLGDLRDVVFNKAVFTDRQGTVKGLVGAIFDITERKQTEDALKGVNRELRAITRCHQTLLRASDEQSLLDEINRIIVEEAGYLMSWVGYVEHDKAKSIIPKAVAGYDQGYVEDIICAHLSWSEDTVQGIGITGEAIRNGRFAYASDIANDTRMAAWRDLAQERGYRSAIALPLKDEQASVFGVMLVYSSEIDAFTSEEIRLMEELSQDLAFGINVLRMREKRMQAEQEREKLQGQLLQAQKMDSIGRLAGGVAHDFNNMLGAIIGYLELALRKTDSEQRVHRYLQQAKQAADRSADLTRHLLAFASKQKVSPKVMDLNTTVAEMLNMLRRLIGEGISLNWSPENRLWPIKLDPSQIDQILANLCVNARDAIGDFGHITMYTKNILLEEADCIRHPESVPGEYVCLSVNDDGCGMDEGVLSNVFEPFFTTKVQGKGTGLGLSTVYGIVKQNAGFIDIDTEPGKGSTFHIYLPRHIGEVEEVEDVGSIKTDLARGNETILLVEDEPAMLDMTSLLLNECGYHVLTASSPTQAIALAKEHAKAKEIDLLITDMVMPEMNGRELAKIIVSLLPGIKSLFMSGFLGDSTLDSSANFIHKPFTAEDFTALIRQVLSQE